MPINISSLRDKFPTAELSNFWDEYKPQIMGGLAGAGIGAAGLGGAAALSGEEDPEVKSRNVKRNLMLGATLGGLGGVGAGAGYKMYDQESPDGMLSKAWDFAKGSRAVQGAGIARGANALLARRTNLGWDWKGSGGSFDGKSIDQLRDMLDGHVKAFQAGPAPTPLPGFTVPTATAPEQGIRDLVNRMTGNNTWLGQMSQNPTLRRFGINTVNPTAEQRIVETLRPMMDTPNGRAALDRILSDQGVKGRGLPLLQKALTGGAAGEQGLQNANRLSGLGRMGMGAGLWSALASILGD